MTDQKTSFIQKVRHFIPPGVLLILAIAVIVGAGLLLFTLASGTGSPSTSTTTSIVMLAPALLGRVA